MNKKIVSLLLALCLVLGWAAGCGSDDKGGKTAAATEPTAEFIDYAGQVELDMESDSAKCVLTVADIKGYVDGDTTHFYVPTSVSPNGVLKARYLAVNTPESTGKIEEWGKKASNFTKTALSGATDIVLESDDGNWNADSTGGRYLVWVWYKPANSDTYRNLNIELLQNGLSIASKSGDNRYGEICTAAINQAKEHELHVHSNEKDPDFYYGEAIPVTLKGLRTNIELYENMKVAFEGVITHENSQTVYVEEYDEETDMYYGMTVYYGYNLTGAGLEILSVGNRVRIVGSVQYYATAGTWQVSDIKYVDMRPDDPSNVQLISSGHEASNRVTDPAVFNNTTMDVEVLTSLDDDETEIKTFSYGELSLGATVSFENVRVSSIYTTSNEESASKGAMTLTCRQFAETIDVRTVVLYDAEGHLITAEAYQGKTINVRGIVDYYNGKYQIKVFSADDITVLD